VENQLFTLGYRVREGTLAWANLQVARRVLRARVRTLLQEGAAGADPKAQGPCRKLRKRDAAVGTLGGSQAWPPPLMAPRARCDGRCGGGGAVLAPSVRPVVNSAHASSLP